MIIAAWDAKSHLQFDQCRIWSSLLFRIIKMTFIEIWIRQFFSFSLFRTLLLAIELILRVKLDCWVSLLKWMYMILTAFVNILLPPTTECSLIQNYVALLILVYRQVGIVTTYTERSVFKKKFTVDNDKKPKQKKYTYIYI